MRDAVIVEAVRTPIGKGKATGALHDDVIGGVVTQSGEQSVNITRRAALAAGLPESVPATTVDRQCGSSQQAIHFAAQGVLAGSYDIAIACGVGSLTHVPHGSSHVGDGKPFGPAMTKRYNGVVFNQGISAEMLAHPWNISRQELDAFSLERHHRAARATADGTFCAQIVPVPLDGGQFMKADEGIRPGSTLEKLASLKPAFKPD